MQGKNIKGIISIKKITEEVVKREEIHILVKVM